MVASNNELRAAAVGESKEDSSIVMGEATVDKIVVDSELESIVIPNPNCCFYLSSFAEQLIRDEYKQLMYALMPAVKPATVTQEQVLAPCSLKFDVNRRRTAWLYRHGKKGGNQKITQVRHSALPSQPTIRTKGISETGT